MNGNVGEDWKKAILNVDSSVRDAASVLNLTGLKIVLVVEHGFKLIGTVSDGDIRRGLLNGFDLESKLINIVQKNAVVAPKETSSVTAVSIMKRNKIGQIPLVDDLGNVVGLFISGEFRDAPKISNLIVIMAGGLGTRLYPTTQKCPKPMIPIGGKPILGHIIDRAAREGFTNFKLAVHHLSNVIEDYFGDGSEFGVNIEYLREASPLGTAGALGLLNTDSREPIIVTNGDVLTEISYSDFLNFHETQNVEVTMAVRSFDWINPFGVIRSEGVKLVSYEEKPKYSFQINAGIYALNRSCLDILKVNESIDMPDLIETVRGLNRQVNVYPIHENWIDIGSPSDLSQAISRYGT